jgi:nitroreductase
MIAKPALTQVPIADIIAQRWSGRAFDPERPVEPEKLLALLEAARWAPSCYGDQPWRFLLWNRLADANHWNRACAALVESNRAWAAQAPILMLAAADETFAHNGQPNRWAQYDTGAAAMSLCLQACALGLMAHQMGGFDAARLKAEFKLPEGVSCMAMIALGYQAETPAIPEALREREFAPRQRRPLAEIAFLGEWENAWRGQD